MNIFEEIVKARKSPKAFAIITVVENNGHGTADPGKKMVLYEDGTHVGTVGGGIFELEVMRKVSPLIKDGDSVNIIEHEKVKLMAECFAPITTIVVVGGGHVGNAVLKTASLLPFTKILVDDRDESQIAESIAFADTFIKCKNYEEAMLSENIPDGAYIFLGAWNHDYDAQALRGALQRNPVYLGMVGSHEKSRKIFAYLLKHGVTQEQLDTVRTPIGLDIADGTPAEIAFAIVAEMLMVKNKGYGTACKDVNDKFLSSSCESMEKPMGTEGQLKD